METPWHLQFFSSTIGWVTFAQVAEATCLRDTSRTLASYSNHFSVETRMIDIREALEDYEHVNWQKEGF